MFKGFFQKKYKEVQVFYTLYGLYLIHSQVLLFFPFQLFINLIRLLRTVATTVLFRVWVLFVCCLEPEPCCASLPAGGTR